MPDVLSCSLSIFSWDIRGREATAGTEGGHSVAFPSCSSGALSLPCVFADALH